MVKHDGNIACDCECHEDGCDDCGGCPNCEDEDDFDPQERDDDFDDDFADPGGNSALRAETEDNPRNLPCPNCDAPNRLTPKDRALGYQCDTCADRAERGFDY